MESRGERVGGVQTHKRMVASLEKQIALQEKKMEQVRTLNNFIKISTLISMLTLSFLHK